jgi:hypothetical protein
MRKREKAAAAHQEAEELMARLKTATPEERRQLVEAFPEYRSWALAVRACAESLKTAAHRVDETREWADLGACAPETGGVGQGARPPVFRGNLWMTHRIAFLWHNLPYANNLPAL